MCSQNHLRGHELTFIASFELPSSAWRQPAALVAAMIVAGTSPQAEPNGVDLLQAVRCLPSSAWAVEAASIADSPAYTVRRHRQEPELVLRGKG